MKSENYRRVLIIYTGGTIGMKMSPKGYIPVANYFGGLLESLPQFCDSAINNSTPYQFLTPPSEFNTIIAYDLLEYSPLLDSCNMKMADWAKIARDITENYDKYEAFVILHGTDTMAFTASALSFMLENLAKTVVITGSQIPVSKIRNDGLDNMMGALLIAGNFDIPEVCLYFNNKLLRGNRSVKLDASNFDAFDCGNFPVLVEVGIDFKVNWSHILSPPSSASFRMQEHMDPHVGALRLFPGITEQVILNFAKPPLKGLVLQTYGAGNAPDNNKEFFSALQSITDRGIIIVNCTQCFRGIVDPQYATGLALREVGVVSGADMTIEAALTKLSYLLAKGYSTQEIRKLIPKNLRGELTEVQMANFSLKSKKLIQSVNTILNTDEGTLVKTLSPLLLCSFASAGDLQRLKELVEKGASINTGDYDGRTAIHLAAAEGYFHVVEYLISQEADVNVVDRWGETPLMDAIRNKQDQVAKLLRDNGAQLQHKNLGELMCTMAAQNNLDTLRRLIENGADPMSSNYDKRTALHIAAAEGNLDIVKYLVTQGVDINIEDRWRGTPLMDAVRHKHSQIVSFLMQE